MCVSFLKGKLVCILIGVYDIGGGVWGGWLGRVKGNVKLKSFRLK